MNGLGRIIEAILFASDGPLSVEQIALGIPHATPEEILSTVCRLREEYESDLRGCQIREIAGGWQLVSHPDLYEYVMRFLEGKRRARLSRASLETLSVIAYRQPITRGEIEEMRGVDCGGVLHTLLERDLITVRGRSTAVGRPLIYVTTEKFLEHFGLNHLGALPKLEELEELLSAETLRAELEHEADRRLARLEPAGGGNGGDAHDAACGSTGSTAKVGSQDESFEEEADPVGEILPEG